MRNILIASIILSGITLADQNLTAKNNSWYDKVHEYFSHKVHLFSQDLDKELVGYSCHINTQCIPLDDQPIKEDDEIAVNDWFSSFYKDEIFDEVYTESYVRVRTTFFYDQRSNNIDPSIAIKASLSLPKIQENINFFIEDNSDDIVSDNYRTEAGTSIGLRYNSEDDNLFNSAYSLGVSSLDNPYARAYFWIPFSFGKWKNRITQSVKYSSSDRLEDETNLYFDRILSDDAFLRFQIGRMSREEVDGMQYYGNIVYNETTRYNKGFKVGVAAWGETKPNNHINTYTAYGVYKQNFFRKWLFYEVEPRIVWERAYGFEPNYQLIFSLEAFFGGL